MTQRKSSLPKFFKGIALFTPGGDLVYSIDPNKQAHWHLHLCLTLQKVFDLSEPPYFLLPGYTATIDRWQNPQTGKVEVCAEVYPPVARYLPLLQVLFALESSWQVVPWREEHCNPGILDNYRQEFPQLWEPRDLIIRLNPEQPDHDTRSVAQDRINATSNSASLPARKAVITQSPRDVRVLDTFPIKGLRKLPQNYRGYVLLLFIASNNINTNQTLDSIHYILEKGLSSPYNLKIIDIIKNPEQAEKNQVSATPTLVRIWPQPIKKIVGALTDLERVIKIVSS
ncbi:MAG: circadian clock KaiB family protein [Xenococcus sp. (in: cyanobacteria)]